MRGAGIEIETVVHTETMSSRRSPCGERGLKSNIYYILRLLGMSLPMRGAGIEISLIVWLMVSIVVAPHAGSGD